MIRTSLGIVIIVVVTWSAAAQDRTVPQPEPTPTGESPPTARSPGPDQTYTLDWWSIDGGGGASTGGSFDLIAAAGQTEAGASSSGGTMLESGLWAGVIDLQLIFADGFETGDTSLWSVTSGAGAAIPGRP